MSHPARYAEYLLPDGSPRFGIRTGDTAAPAVPADPHVNVGQAAAQAALMTGPELRSAADYRFVLDGFGTDEQLIADLRKAHPEELAAAKAVVADSLGSPRKWLTASESRFINAAVGSGVDPSRTFRALTGYLALAAIPFLTAIAAVLLGLDGWIVWAMILFATLGLRPAQRKVFRKARGAVSSKISPEDRQMLWDDVVNATLLEVLASKGLGIDPYTSHAARRGFTHIRYAAGLTAQLLELPS